MLSGLLVLTLPSLAASGGLVTVTSLSHSVLPVEGTLTVTVHGTGFVQSPHGTVCRVSNLPGAAVSFDTHVVPATVLNSTALRCTPAPVHSDGLGTLTVSMDNRTFSQNASVPIQFYPLFSVAIGRRPYISETQGTVLIDPGGQSGSDWEREMLTLTGGSCGFEASVGSHRLFTQPAYRVSGSVLSIPFDLTKLPATLVDTLNVSIACKTGLRLNKYREFQRYPPANGSVSVSQVDHSRAGLLVDGEPWIGLGWYYSTLDQGIYEPGYAADRKAIAELAKTGVTQLMIYSFVDEVTGGEGPNITERRLILDQCQAVGVKVMVKMTALIDAVVGNNGNAPTPKPGRNTSKDWAALSSTVAELKEHPAVLGWYLCDDCCESMEFNTVLMRQAYIDIKFLDPYHVTIGAIDCGDTWMYSDGEMSPGATDTGRLSLDVPMIENYNIDLAAHATAIAAGGSYDQQLRQWPMQFEPIVNCPQGESSWEDAAAPFTPRMLRALTYTGLVLPATMVYQLYFDLCSMTEQSIINAVSNMALELQELMPSLLHEATDSPPTATSSDPRILVRAFSEPPAVGSDSDFCFHIIAINTVVQPVQTGIAVREATTTSFSSSPVVNVTLPFEADIRVYASARGGVFVDSLPGGGARVYRMGCTMPLADKGCLDPKNQLMNPDFEWGSTLGGVAGWCGSRAGFYAQDNHDDRATCHLDTRRPKHGRRCLRIVSPTDTETMTFPFQGSGAGLDLQPNTNYSIRVWARSQPTGLQLSVVNGSWTQSRAPAVYMQAGPAFTMVYLTQEWQLVEAQVKATDGHGALQLRVHGQGMLFLDDAFVGANASMACPGPMRACGGGCAGAGE